MRCIFITINNNTPKILVFWIISYAIAHVYGSRVALFSSTLMTLFIGTWTVFNALRTVSSSP